LTKIHFDLCRDNGTLEVKISKIISKKHEEYVQCVHFYKERRLGRNTTKKFLSKRTRTMQNLMIIGTFDILIFKKIGKAISRNTKNKPFGNSLYLRDSTIQILIESF